MAAAFRRSRKRRSHFHRRTLPGAPPGFLVPDPQAPSAAIRVMAYGPDNFIEETLTDLRKIPDYLERWPVTWINVDGLGDTTVVSQIGKIFGFHQLAMEDVVHVHQRAKVDIYDSYFFIVARMPLEGQQTCSEQISLFLGKNFLVTFQERPGGDCLETIRTRIRTGMSKVRGSGPDYLMYAILDTVLDNYFPLLENCGERLDVIEEAVLEQAGSQVMASIHEMKRDLLTIRRAVWPLRDAIQNMLRESSPLVSDSTLIYLRDCHDHTIQIIDLLENYRDITSGLTDIYLSSVSMRTNEIMKVLTIISTIFIPLTFVVGVYGMNFDTTRSPWNMPELSWYWGYPAIWSVMILVCAGMLYFFFQKGWFNFPERQANNRTSDRISGS